MEPVVAVPFLEGVRVSPLFFSESLAPPGDSVPVVAPLPNLVASRRSAKGVLSAVPRELVVMEEPWVEEWCSGPRLGPEIPEFEPAVAAGGQGLLAEEVVEVLWSIR